MPTRADTVRGPSTESIAELVGGEGETPARAPVRELSWCLGAGCGCGRGQEHGELGPRVVQALIPTSQVGARLRIRRMDGSQIV